MYGKPSIFVIFSAFSGLMVLFFRAWNKSPESLLIGHWWFDHGRKSLENTLVGTQADIPIVCCHARTFLM